MNIADDGCSYILDSNFLKNFSKVKQKGTRIPLCNSSEVGFDATKTVFRHTKAEIRLDIRYIDLGIVLVEVNAN